MKHAMSKKMDRFITAMTQFAGLRMKVGSMHLCGVHCYIVWPLCGMCVGCVGRTKLASLAADIQIAANCMF